MSFMAGKSGASTTVMACGFGAQSTQMLQWPPTFCSTTKIEKAVAATGQISTIRVLL